MGREAGADFAWTCCEARGGATRFGRGVPHISHIVRAGWLRKVHIEHATSSLGPLGGLAGLGEDEEDVGGCVRWVVEDGREEERRLVFEEVAAPSERGTPQRAHIREAAGLRPGGLR